MAVAFLQEEIEKDFNITSPIANAQTGLPDSAIIRMVIGKYLEKSMENLDANPEEFLRCRTNAGVAEKIAKDKIGLAFSIQGLGFIYEEKLGQVDTAFYFINSSLGLWNEINDTMQRANLYKYRGYLWGLIKKFEEGLRDIDTALMLYTAKHYEPGIAVSQRNLASIYFEMGNGINRPIIFLFLYEPSAKTTCRIRTGNHAYHWLTTGIKREDDDRKYPT